MKPYRLTRIATLVAMLSTGPAHALDVDAGDYTALPAGTNLALLYYQHASRDALYQHGRRADLDAGLTSDIGIFRAVHFADVADHRIDVQFLLPFGRLEGKDDLATMGTAHGMGDLILASAVWLLNSPDTGRYFGITPYLFLPTGNYDRHDALNLGENRWKLVLQAGYITPLSKTVTLDVVADATLFGDNDDFGISGATLEQKPLYQFQTFLRYHVSPQWDLRAGLSHAFGGETSVDGVNQDDRTRTTKANVGTAWFATPSVQVVFNYGRDLSVENGLREDNRVNLRLLKVF
ncbi:transporter [Nitrogeniibacter aestuarii]|uniref:transporter n=1 Tax=Nitrogeniibacter aestuarii TaxID=2815343 RepID=UPI001E5F6AA0|nr:transporter [Nitrogeniibacter aestuarii]